MKKIFFYAVLIAFSSLGMFACKDSSDSKTQLDLISLSSAQSGIYTIELLGLKPIETGYNRLFWQVNKSGAIVKMDSIRVNPLMDMTTMVHSCPKELPFASVEADGKFEGYMVFIMPSGSMGTWAISVTAYLSNGEMIEANLDISVANSWKLQSFTYKDVKYFVSWMSPQDPFVGKNIVQVLIHKKATMMSFPSTDDLKLEMYPYMDMGGGEGHSAPFEQLQKNSLGSYKGSISYSMSGDWKITISAFENSENVAEVVFSMNVISK